MLSCIEPVFANLFDGVFYAVHIGAAQLLGTAVITVSAVLAVTGRGGGVPDTPIPAPAQWLKGRNSRRCNDV